MKIAIFSDQFYPELSGITDSIITLGKELSSRGHSIDYFVPRYSSKDYKTGRVAKIEINMGQNTKVHRMFSFPFSSPTLQGRAVLPNFFRQIINDDKFDIIHSHLFFGAGLEAMCFSKLKKIPIVGTNHTLLKSFLQYSPIRGESFNNLSVKYMTWYYNRCDFVTVPGEFLLKDMKNDGLVSPSKLISNPIQREFFTPSSPKDSLKKKLNFSAFTFLYAGRISSEKNVEILFDAFELFAQKAKDANLVMVGQGLLRKKLEDRMNLSSFKEQIKIIGPFLGEEKNILYDIFHASDVFVMPSTSENQSMVMLQSMASGMPVIGANAGGLPLSMGEKTGVLFDPNSAQDLSSKMETLYFDSNLREELSRGAKFFTEHLSAKLVADDWEKLYKDVIKQYHEKS